MMTKRDDIGGGVSHAADFSPTEVRGKKKRVDMMNVSMLYVPVRRRDDKHPPKLGDKPYTGLYSYQR